MSMVILYKLLIIALFIAIFISLTGGLVFLAKDKGGSRRAVYSLTARVILSVTLFILLILGYMAGWLQPHGLENLAAPASSRPSTAE
jgi:hypothetical protein